MGFDKIWSILDSYTIGETGYVFLLDDEGRILSHPDKKLVFSKTSFYPPVSQGNLSGVTQFVFNREEMICGYASILRDIFTDKGFWCVVATQQTTEAFSSILLFRDQFTVFIVIVGTLFTVAGAIFSYKITEPIKELRERC